MGFKFLKISILIISMILISGITSCAPEEFLSESRTDKVGINSKVLGIFMTIEIHLPRGYSDEEQYPVLYLLHDYACDESSIRQAGFFMMADILTEQGLIEPMLIVSPQINNSYLLNSSDETIIYGEDGVTGLYSGMFEEYFTKEVISYIEATYNASPDREKRFIGGISTGGYAALRMAFANPDMFSKAGAHMPALWTPGMELMEMDLLGWYYPDANTQKSRNPVEIAYNNRLDEMSIFIDCGDMDWYSKPFAEELVQVLDKKNYNYDFKIFAGKHDLEYISEHVTDYLMFYGGK
jgi:enterochelin esterase-like enzyme